MLTKKEKLLIRPWIVQRYNQHREKVKKATPRIDFMTPKEHVHVVMKLKKAQKEQERREQIEHENIRLLQRLGSIMTKKRIDNFWSEPRPGHFLSRVPIFEHSRRPSASSTRDSTIRDISILSEDPKYKSMSKSAYRCSACSSTVDDYKEETEVIEERIPFPPPKESKNEKLRGASEPHICCMYCC